MLIVGDDLAVGQLAAPSTCGYSIGVHNQTKNTYVNLVCSVMLTRTPSHPTCAYSPSIHNPSSLRPSPPTVACRSPARDYQSYPLHPTHGVPSTHVPHTNPSKICHLRSPTKPTPIPPQYLVYMTDKCKQSCGCTEGHRFPNPVARLTACGGAMIMYMDSQLPVLQQLTHIWEKDMHSHVDAQRCTWPPAHGESYHLW